MNEILTKKAFAEMLGVTPSCVSHWIGEGRLGGSALVGSGCRSRILLPVAIDQLKLNLDLSQRLGANGKARLDGPVPTASGAIEDEIKRARLEQLALSNAKAREEAAARSGRYVPAADVTQQMGRIAGQLVTMFDGALAELAAAAAEKFGLSPREVLHLLRTEFRAIRARASAVRREAAGTLPALVEDDPPAEADAA